MASLLLLPLAAHAGSYVGAFNAPGTNTPSPYSGGTHFSITGSPSPGHYTFGDVADAVTNGTYGGTSNGNGVSGEGTHSDCSGAVSTSWNWVPTQNMTMTTDPPPTAVIVSQVSTVSVGIGQPGGTATYATGLGKSGSASFNPPKSTGGMATDTLYSTPTGGATVSLKALNAQANVTNGNSSASLSYTATISPVQVKITGTNSPTTGDYRVLTGQQITATLTGIPTGYTVTKYTWAAGGSTFKTYDWTLKSNQLVPLGSSDLTGPASGSTSVTPLNFYDSAQENLTVICAVTVTAPDGNTINLTANSPPINVLKPTVTWSISTGYIQHVQNPSGQRGYQLMQVPGSTQAGGEAWSHTTIVVPAPFAAVGGSGCFAQLVTPDTEFTNDDPAKVPVNPVNKQQGLDTSFPYKKYQWDVSAPGANFDGPGLFYENLNSGGYAGWTQVSDSNTFTTWVMYQPPGGVWVPLQSYDWDCSFTSQWDKSESQWNLFRARPALTSGDPGYKGADTTTPPQWSLVQTYT